MTKKVSVLMGIYNCASTLPRAVACIQAQTYGDWELILCEDGSSDDTLAVAEGLAREDGRIVLLKNPRNLGLNWALNRCFEAAGGAYLARMDGDDECLPERFEKQVAFLEANPEYAIVSTAMTLFDEGGDWGQIGAPAYPQPRDVVCDSPIAHPAVMMRRECLETVHGYSTDPKTLRVEDVDLWIRLYAAGYRCHNLAEPLYRFREDQNALSRRKYKYRVASTRVRLKGCRLLGLGAGCYVQAFSPMLIGLVPPRLRAAIKRIVNRTKPEEGTP